MDNVLDCDIVLIEFKQQSSYQFRISTIEKGFITHYRIG